MKINPHHWKENADDRKSSRPSRAAEARRADAENDARQAAKSKQLDAPLKDELKFAGILKSATNPQKLKQADEDASQQRREDDKENKKRSDAQKDSADSVSNNDRVEKFNQFGGGNSGGGGFGAGGNVNQTFNLSDNFAARSILHIADLERMISAIRSQTRLGGKREIYLSLKRSVLEGLQVKITTDEAARVQIEFLAADEKVRSQIENHAAELSEILRGRGINLQSLTTIVNAETSGDAPFKDDESDSISTAATENENTFENEPTAYRA